MTARRIISSHLELEHRGSIIHSELDTHVSGTTFIVVSGSNPPNSRTLKSGIGITLTDAGPASDLTVALTTSGTNIVTFDNHKTLKHLVHLAGSDGPFDGFTSGATKTSGPTPFPTGSVWWTDGTMTKKIFDKEITRNDKQQPTVITWRAYHDDGITVTATVTDTYTYDGAFAVSKVRTIA